MTNNKKIFLFLSAILISGFSMADKIKEAKAKPKQTTVKVQIGNCPITTAQVDLDINNVRARILNAGDIWWDPVSQTPYYEVPIGGNKNSLYTGAIWIGGYDFTGALKVAAQTYRQQGANDFWSGPISKDPGSGALNVSDATCNEYDRFWVLTKEEVTDFVNGGEATPAIKDYPGNGDVGNNELQFLAPFFDANNDGTYDYTQGDYPNYNLSGEYTDTAFGGIVCNDYLFGDKTLWWVFNDVGNIHTETGSDPIGLEIRAQAFGFKTNDEINNMTFYKFQIINRASDSLLQTYMGAWADPDLGNASDDYVGCDVGLGLGFCYNGDPDDDGADGYGLNPPAVGIDFFQGPLADANDGIDNDRDGVTDEAGEQIAMSKFVYYENLNNSPIGNPATTDDYYQYLDGKWLDGLLITHGATGRDQSLTPCDFMFPGTTDPAFSDDWTMPSAGIAATDMRFVQSAGKFSLAPGAVNYVTTGVVWERATSGGPLASLALVKLADQKAQSLFDNCFKVLDGPDAPTLAIRELDQLLTISLENTNTKRIEQYNEIDPAIPPSILDDSGNIITLTDQQKSYQFQGYKIYQLRDKNVSSSDLDDISKARLIRQMDINDGIAEIINFELDQNINLYVPVKKTENVNAGLVHSFNVTNDLFTGQKLVNYQPYYFMAISYAYNNFAQFDEDDPNLTQENPYFPGRLNIRVYSGIPHKPLLNNGGTVLNSAQGALNVEIKRIEGEGNGGNILDLTDGTTNEILNDPLHRSLHPVYTGGRGPVKIGIYDPFKAQGGDHALKFTGVGDTSIWQLLDRSNSTIIDSSGASLVYTNEEIVESKGLTITAYKVAEPGMLSADGATLAANNGFLDASIEFKSGPSGWLTGVPDDESYTSQDWIRSGDPDNFQAKYGDPDSAFERVLGGTWAPYLLTDQTVANPGSPKLSNPLLDPNALNLPTRISWTTLNSVDVVITPDKSKWSRTVVFNTTSGGTIRFNKRKQPSVNKEGQTSIGGAISTDPNDPNFIDTVGMGWFPGYAINVETGERLNIAFGEDSTFASDNGNDMLWNPTGKMYDDVVDTLPVFGGKHYIYIFNKYFADTTARIPKYDNGWRIDSLVRTGNTQNKLKVFKSCIWTSLPLTNNFTWQGNVPPGEVKVRLRVAKTYQPFISEAAPSVINNGNPYYEFNVPGTIAPTFNVTEVAKTALDNVNVVPNPYYAYSSYEKTREDQLDQRVRLTNLPSRCTVSIYTVNGTLIKQIKRDVGGDISQGQAVEEGQDFNLSSTLDWDLKNTAGIPIASGIYIIHVDAGDLGEKVIKWFGVMRPLDLDTF